MNRVDPARTAVATLLAVLFLGGLLPHAALAGRAPTDAERKAIGIELKAHGFVSWGEIELDDGLWEVDDAKSQSGLEYELYVEPETYTIVRRERDDD